MKNKVEDISKIIDYLQANKEMFFNQFGITRIGIFGSFISGEFSKSSDIDILIDMKKEYKTLHNFMALKRILEKQFKRKVDLGFFNSLKPLVKKEIKDKIYYV